MYQHLLVVMDISNVRTNLTRRDVVSFILFAFSFVLFLLCLVINNCLLVDVTTEEK